MLFMKNPVILKRTKVAVSEKGGDAFVLGLFGLVMFIAGDSHSFYLCSVRSQVKRIDILRRRPADGGLHTIGSFWNVRDNVGENGGIDPALFDTALWSSASGSADTWWEEGM